MLSEASKKKLASPTRLAAMLINENPSESKSVSRKLSHKMEAMLIVPMQQGLHLLSFHLRGSEWG